jgi:hypothetical protein
LIFFARASSWSSKAHLFPRHDESLAESRVLQ